MNEVLTSATRTTADLVLTFGGTDSLPTGIAQPMPLGMKPVEVAQALEQIAAHIRSRYGCPAP